MKEDCVICSKAFPLKANTKTRSRAKSKSVFEKNFIQDAEEKCVTLENQLPVIFLLRKLLNIPDEMCTKFLQNNGNPFSWIFWCDSCAKLISDAEHLFQEIQQLQKKLNSVGDYIKNTIVLSTEDENSCWGRKKTKFGPAEEIRSYIFQESRSLETSKAEIKIENECYGVDTERHSDLGNIDEFINSDLAEECISQEDELKSKLRSNSRRSKESDENEWEPEENSDDSDSSAEETILGLKSEVSNNISQKKKPTPGKRKRYARKRNGEKEKVTCEICFREYLEWGALRRHFSRRHGEFQYSCEYCKYKAVSKDELEKHKERYRCATKTILFCDICDKGLSSEFILMKHREILHGLKEDGKIKENVDESINIKPTEKRKLKKDELKSKPRRNSRRSKENDETELEPEENRDDSSFVSEETVLDLKSEVSKEISQDRKSKPGKRKHARRVRKKIAVKCEICFRKYTKWSDLRRHFSRHHGEFPYSCEYCKHKMVSQEELEKHKERFRCSTKTIFFCEICDKGLSSEFILMNHREVFHGPEEKRKNKENIDESINSKPTEECKSQEDELKSKPQSNSKRSKENDETEWEPDENGDDADSSAEETRLDLKSGNSEDISEEQKSTPVKGKQTTQESSGSLKCEICFRNYLELNSLRRHFSRRHGEFPYSCEYCKHKMVSKQELEIHKEKYRCEKKRTFFCDICEKYLSTEFSLMKHREIIHGLKEQRQNKENIDESVISKPTEERISQEDELKSKPKSNSRTSKENDETEWEPDENGDDADSSAEEPLLDFKNDNSKGFPEEEKSTPGKGNEKSLDSLKCEICFRNYLEWNSLRRHFSRLHGEFPYSCEYCKHKMVSKEEVEMHKERYRCEKKRIFFCDICDKGLSSEFILMNHREVIHGLKEQGKINEENVKSKETDVETELESVENVQDSASSTDKSRLDLTNDVVSKEISEKQKWNPENRKTSYSKKKCELCFREFFEWYGLRQHFLRKHGEFQYSCDYCKYEAVSKVELEKHKEKCRFNRTKVIKVCNKSVSSERKLMKRREILRGPKEKKKRVTLKCEKCDEVFHRSRALQRHMKSHSRIQRTIPDETECKICEKHFKNPTVLKGHYRLKHLEEYKIKYAGYRTPPEYKCTFFDCNYKTIEKNRIQAHMKIHLPKKERPFVCDKCGDSFTQNQYLELHQQSKHYEELGLNPFKCDQCGKIFNSPFYMKKHIKNVHENSFKFTCPICNKGFEDKSKYDDHMQRHEGIKRFLCAECGAAFVTQNHLKTHIRIVHNTERPFACKQCPSKFKSSSYLRRHVQGVHSNGVRPHKCEFCPKTFPVRNYLYIHLRSHRKDKRNQ